MYFFIAFFLFVVVLVFLGDCLFFLLGRYFVWFGLRYRFYLVEGSVGVGF